MGTLAAALLGGRPAAALLGEVGCASLLLPTLTVCQCARPHECTKLLLQGGRCGTLVRSTTDVGKGRCGTLGKGHSYHWLGAEPGEVEAEYGEL